jgi:hypothetical protein
MSFVSGQSGECPAAQLPSDFEAQAKKPIRKYWPALLGVPINYFLNFMEHLLPLRCSLAFPFL